MCDLLSLRAYLLPETEVKAFEMQLSGHAGCDRRCPAFPDVYALDGEKQYPWSVSSSGDSWSFGHARGLKNHLDNSAV